MEAPKAAVLGYWLREKGSEGRVEELSKDGRRILEGCPCLIWAVLLILAWGSVENRSAPNG